MEHNDLLFLSSDSEKGW